MEKKITSSELMLQLYCENVKPSSPTPLHLQTYKLSMFDQIIQPVPVPLVLYFANTTSTSGSSSEKTELVEQLKSALSLTLTQFYPVAGRISADCQSIDCNDQGVPFYVINIKASISDLMKPHPDPDLWARLFPYQLTHDVEWGPSSNVAMIQVTRFDDCGGVALAVVFWHRVADAVTIASFLKYWAAAARKFPDTCPGPNYIIPSLFPLKEELRSLSRSDLETWEKGRYVTRVYVFDGPAIQRLKAQLSSSNIDSPTRFEMVTALLWKCYMVASIANGFKVSAIYHPVNLRRRARPPLPPECFGNVLSTAVAWCTNLDISIKTDINNDHDDDGYFLGHLVKVTRDAIRKINDECINRLSGDQGLRGLGELYKLTHGEIPERADNLVISSWCNMGFYDVDFGWGKPAWMAREDGVGSSLPRGNSIWLMDTRLGRGVEAWVTLEEKHMKVFENVEQLVNHVVL